MKPSITRRHFLETASLAGAGLSLALPRLASAGNDPGTTAAVGTATEKPVVLGGKPLCGSFPTWPVFDQTEEKAVLDTLHSGKWYRGWGKAVSQFEEAYAKLTGAKYCIATSCGTSALYAALATVEIGPGDEVIIPPYTFIATYNVVVLNYALPVFVDSDLESFQIDANKIEAAITDRTRAILPVHIGGAAANLDRILEVANKHKIAVIEDACQSHLAEWRGRKVGTWGAAGCFSFQASKNLCAGEGGAVLTNDDRFAAVCRGFHDQGRAPQSKGFNFAYSGTRGSNLRLCEFQGSLLVAQMTRIEEQTKRRTENAEYLTKLLQEIPGILTMKMHDGCTRNAYYLYMFRYHKEQFANMPRSKFLSAVQKENVPAWAGYSPLNKDQYVRDLVKSRYYQKIYTQKELAQWEERNRCPVNDQLCAEAVWLPQNMLLGQRTDMERVAEAVRRIQKHAAEVAKA